MLLWIIVKHEQIQKEQAEHPDRTSATFLMSVIVFFAWPLFLYRAVAGRSAERGQTPYRSERRSRRAYSSSARRGPNGAPSRPLGTSQRGFSADRRHQRVQLPPDILTRLESYGRVSRQPGAAEATYGMLEYELYQLAQTDRDGLIEAVAEVAHPVGGWTTYGAARAIWSVVDPDVEGLEHPAYRELLTQGLEFMRESGFNPVPLGRHEEEHWARVGGEGATRAGKPTSGKSPAADVPDAAHKDRLSREYLSSAPPGPRTDNLAISCVQQIVELDVTHRSRFGEPLTVAALGKASGLVRETMTQDRDLSAWIARKGAVILDAVLRGGMRGGFEANMDRAFGAAGLEIGSSMLVRDDRARLSKVDRDTAESLGKACLALVVIVGSQPTDWTVRERRFYVSLFTGQDGADAEGFAYELIAWIGVVIGRLYHRGLVGLSEPLLNPAFRQVPRLTRAGWYPNPPKFGDTSSGDAPFQRYWDGAQWTARVRVRQEQAWREAEYSLHDPPSE